MRAAQRKDSGKYQISVKILDEFEDVATFDLLVIGKDNEAMSADKLSNI